MKILVLCDMGINRSVHIASLLKFVGDPRHDVISAGLIANSYDTLSMLCGWADRIIVVEPRHQVDLGILGVTNKVQVWDTGPDTYPRPFNKELLGIVRKHIADHIDELR